MQVWNMLVKAVQIAKKIVFGDKHVVVYECYDVYDHLRDFLFEERTRIKYVVLGNLDTCKQTIVVCYIPSGSVATLPMATHKRSWVVNNYTVSRDYIRDCAKNDITKYVLKEFEEEVAWLEKHKAETDGNYNVHVGSSTLGYDSKYGINFQCSHGQSYTETIINELQKKMQILTVRDRFLVGEH
jgi:hypothetical protein